MLLHLANLASGDYFKSLKNVVLTNEEISKALEDYIRSMQAGMQDQRDFIAFVDHFRRNVTSDLRQSAQDTSNLIQWVVSQAEKATSVFLEKFTSTTQEATAEAAVLSEVSLVNLNATAQS